MAYGLPFYRIVWILVRQGPFMDQEFGNDYLGLFRNLFGRHLYRVEASKFSWLASIWCEFLLRSVSTHVLVFVTYLFFIYMVYIRRGAIVGEFSFGRVPCWCNFINNESFCNFMGLPSVGECISSKGNG